MSDTLFILPNVVPGATKYVSAKIVQQASGFHLFSFDYADNPDYPSSDVIAAGANLVNGDFAVQSGVINAANDTDVFIWTAFTPCQVIQVSFMQSVIEDTSDTTTLMPRKVPSGTALASGSALLAAAQNLKSGVVANTVANGTLNATLANLQFAAGDSLGLDFTNALTEYIGVCTVWFKRISD